MFIIRREKGWWHPLGKAHISASWVSWWGLGMGVSFSLRKSAWYSGGTSLFWCRFCLFMTKSSICNVILSEAKGSLFHWCATFRERKSANTKCYAVWLIDQFLFLKVLHKTVLTCRCKEQKVGCTQEPMWTYLRIARHVPLLGREPWLASL
jgi:hypothetical protein